MPLRSLRRALLALALMAPLSAAHPTETATTGAAAQGVLSDFDGSFESYRQLPPAPVPGGEAVDLAPITHTHSSAAPEAGAGRPLGGGTASYYGRQFDGRRTASGERFDMRALTAAHRTLPFGTRVRVTNPANGRSVVVRINDRGPFHRGRTIDVSHAAAERLGLVSRGHGRVELTVID